MIKNKNRSVIAMNFFKSHLVNIKLLRKYTQNLELGKRDPFILSRSCNATSCL